MGGEWKTASLGEICDFRAGSVFKPDLQGRTSGEIPFVKVSDMNLPANAARIQDANNWVSAADLRELRAKPLPPGTVVFAKIGEALRQNRLRQIARETIIDNNMMGAVPRSGRVEPRFLYYALSRFDFSDIAQGTALPYLTVGSLTALTLNVPPLAEQRAIAHILGTLDDKIELNRRRNQTLEAMARALFKDWFIDFGPVRRNAAQAQNQPSPGLRPPSPRGRGFENTAHEPLPSPPGRGAGGEGVIEGQTFDHVFPDCLDDEGKPEGWEMKRISDYLSLAYGKSLPAGQRHQGGIPVYGSGGITGLHNEALVNGPTVIVGRKGTVGSLYWEDRPCFPIDTVFYVQPEAPLSFCYYLLESLPLRDMNTDAAVPGLNRENVYRLEVAAPPTALIKAFTETASRFRETIAAISKESETLAQLRDTLLPKLISGELRVPDAEYFVKEFSQ